MRTTILLTLILAVLAGASNRILTTEFEVDAQTRAPELDKFGKWH
jgi:hypothetical protein